jgi:hypothetical protein
MTAVKADLTAVDADLKDLYTHNTIAELVYPDNPILGWIPKGAMGGRKVPVPIRYGLPTGRSKTFANAQANASPSKFESWDMIATKDYADVLIDGLAAYSTDSKNEAFMNLVESELEGGMKAVGLSLEISLTRKSTGSRGQVSSGSTVSTNTISFALKSDATNWEIGQLVRASATDGAAHRTGSETILKVDRVANTITSTSAAWNTNITALAVGDFLYVDGDLNGNLSGFEDWVPAAAPSNTLFYGVDRSVDNRLGGSRYDGSGDLIKDAFIKGMAIASREGARGDRVIWCSDAAYAAFEIEMGSNVQLQVITSQQISGPFAKVGFEGIKLASPYGTATVLASRAVPQDRAWICKTSSWEMLSIHDPVVSMDSMDDVGRVLRAPNDDAYEGRAHFYGNVVCHEPGQQCRVTLPATVTL